MSTCPTCRKAFAAGTFCPGDGSRLVDEHMDGSVVLDGRYRLMRKVGAGGMGEVYEAEHIHIHRKVAVKILRAEIASDVDAIARLKREAQTTSGLGHPNIVETFDFGQADGQAYLVMEWLDGENLDQRIERGPIDISTALEIAAQVAAGLAEAHACGVVHRDVKPANIFLTTDRRGTLVVKIVDFGIAKLASNQVRLTATGVLIGTPNYMAPEQAMEPIDARTDVYALGVILYEMVTGLLPFRGDTPLAILHQHTSKSPVPPSESAADRGISSEVEAVILRCLAKRPGDRFASMLELARAIEDIRGTGNSTHQQSQALPGDPPSHSRSAPVASRSVAPEVQSSFAPSPEPETDDALLAAATTRRGRGIWIAIVAFAAIAAGLAVVLISRGSSTSDTHPGSAPISNAPGSASVSFDASVASPDASVASRPPPDAITLGSDGGNLPVSAAAWRHQARARQFEFVATSPAAPVAGEPFELTVVFDGLSTAIESAKAASSLRVDLKVEYFRDHATVHASSHTLVADAFSVTIKGGKVGKHHVKIAVFDGSRALDSARFDIVFPVPP